MAATGLVPPLSIKAHSWDTQPRGTTPPPPSTIHAPSFNHFKKKVDLLSVTKKTTQTKQTTTPKTKKESINVVKLLELNNPMIANQDEGDELYLGCERWLPSAPKVDKPRSIYNVASLAYIGDCIYELYARRHFFYPPLSIEDYNDRVMAVVRCEAQDALLKKLLQEDFLSEEERDLLRWGKNINSGKTRTTKRAGVAVYNNASSLETLMAIIAKMQEIEESLALFSLSEVQLLEFMRLRFLLHRELQPKVGYLYLTNAERLEDLMLKLGFTTSASNQLIMEEPRKTQKRVVVKH